MRTSARIALRAALTLGGAAAIWVAAIQARTAPAQDQPQQQGAQVQAGQAQGPPAQAGQGRAAGGRGTPVPGGRGGPPAVAKKHLLVIGQTMGSFHHGSTSEGVASFWKMGKDSNIWDTELKTDMEWVTKKDPGSEAHSLPYFDAIVFVNTTGNWKLDDEQKEALLSFIRDDGKGLVLVHAAIDSNYNWPEWAEMTGGWFNGHPWGTFEGSIIVEDQSFPAMRHFPKYLKLHDEMYSTKNWSRDKVNVLMRLDESKLNYSNPRAGSGPQGGTPGAGGTPPAGSAPPAGAARAGAPPTGGAQGRGGGEPSMRTDKDQAVAWAKMYGKGRVFYSTFGHTKEAWENPDILRMYTEAVKWVMGLTEGSTASHPKVN